MKAKVFVTLRNGVLDPQGKAITHALHTLGFSDVMDVRQGKFFEVQLQGDDKEKNKQMLTQICEKLLANSVIEDYSFEVLS